MAGRCGGCGHGCLRRIPDAPGDGDRADGRLLLHAAHLHLQLHLAKVPSIMMKRREVGVCLINGHMKCGSSPPGSSVRYQGTNGLHGYTMKMDESLSLSSPCGFLSCRAPRATLGRQRHVDPSFPQPVSYDQGALPPEPEIHPRLASSPSVRLNSSSAVARGDTSVCPPSPPCPPAAASLPHPADPSPRGRVAQSDGASPDSTACCSIAWYSADWAARLDSRRSTISPPELSAALSAGPGAPIGSVSESRNLRGGGRRVAESDGGAR